MLLDRLHEDLVNRAKEVTQMESEGDQKNVNNKPQSSSVISDTFQGLLKNEVIIGVEMYTCVYAVLAHVSCLSSGNVLYLWAHLY